MKLTSFVMAMVVALTIAASAQVVDSPWPMFRHDLHHTGRTPYTGPAEPSVNWVFTDAKDGIASSPTIGEDGTIYVGAGWDFRGVTDSSLYAINPDGSLKWRFATEGGVFSSPAIGPEGIIYFGSLDRHLYAVEDSITYGKLRWRTSLGNFGVYSSPAVGVDGTIYVGGINFSVYAINPDGTVKWAYPTGWCVFSSPAIGPDGEIYIGSKDEHLYAFEDSVTYAKLRWRHATGEFYDGYLVDSSPAIGSDGTIYVGTDPYGAAGLDPVPVDSVLFAIRPDGSLKWKFAMGDGAESSPAIGPDGTIYVGSYDSNLYAIEDKGDFGALKWKFPTGGWVDGSPTVDGCGTIYFGSRDSTLYALNPDGSVRWSFPAGGEIESSPTIDGQGILYITTFAGELYALGSGGSDVGVVRIDMPAGVKAGSTYAPAAIVRNYRSYAQSFGVSCLIDTAGYCLYEDTVYVTNLAGGTSVRRSFSPWTVAPDTGIIYTITVATFLAGDANWYNDTLTTQAESVVEVVGLSHREEEEEPRRFSLGQCYPNPFNTQTLISYSVGERGDKSRVWVSLGIYDLLGREVRNLVDAPQGSGSYRVFWDGKDWRGREVASGIYFSRLEAGGFVCARKMIFLK